MTVRGGEGGSCTTAASFSFDISCSCHAFFAPGACLRTRLALFLGGFGQRSRTNVNLNTVLFSAVKDVFLSIRTSTTQIAA